MVASQNFGGTHFGRPSLVVPRPCQADVLYEQLNYICVNDEIRCLLGWKVMIVVSSYYKKVV